jgi:hypothetical protein
MVEEKSGPSSDLHALAREACDLWQEHLASYANDPKAKAELMRLLTPSRQLFAEWATMMQNDLYGATIFGKNGSPGEKGGREVGADGGSNPGSTGSHAPGSETARPSSGGSDIKLTQLADRVARLEERLARLDACTSGKTKASRSTSRPRTKS